MSARLPAVLLAFAPGEALHRDELARRTGWSTETAAKALGNAKLLGFIEAAGFVGKLQTYTLTDDGRARQQEFRDSGLAPAAAPGDLGERALDMIANTAEGCDSDQLAQALGVSVADIDAALEPHVASRRLVCCDVKRNVLGALRELRLYRTSSGLASRNDWYAQKLRSWGNREQPAAEPAPILGLQGRVIAVDEAAELLDAAAAPREPQQAVPYLGELDIDAVHRRRGNAPAAAGDAPAVTGDVVREDECFLCALYSDGTLWLQSGGQQISLPVSETRALLHYLDHVCGAEIAAGEPV